MKKNNRKTPAPLNNNLGVFGVQQTKTIVSHRAIPEPEELEKYEAIVPGAAERILSMAEKNGGS